ncbi:hypothetical protein UFOVP405_50 [uncultured Caudovirales phage]|uniref:Uncharacterized protein n=1 Tax=uncultured Caudovirales phage TaxID=2100421 RepID=A0A6J5M4Z9_9CAUD|nr:hypothetical protein UFOVP405_50 [uncultured Caudovirales phage]
MDKIQLIDKNNASEILEEIENAYFDIPFGNTDFQCENFVIANAITPARAYRIIGLQIQTLLASIEETKYSEKIKQIDIMELEEKLNDPSISKYEKMRDEIKLERLKKPDTWHQKLVNDTIRQLNLYYAHFKRLPKYTREQFEQQEKLYFEQSQRRQMLGVTGAKEAIMNMIDDKKTIEQFEKAWAELPENKKHELLDQVTRQSMAGMIEFQGDRNET